MKVRIITDSTADISSEVKEKLWRVPLTVHFGNEEYTDGVTITHEEFYKKLETSDVLPTTSQATPFAFEEVFEKAIDNGESVVAITLSSKLSGTYQSAVIAAESFPGKVFVVDSGSVAIGAGILAERALVLEKSGMDAESIARSLEKEREYIRIIALLDTLENLKRSGRISKTVAFAGELLSIKPLICLKDGNIDIIGKARGKKQGNKMFVEEVLSDGGINFDKPVMLGYTGLDDESLKKFISSSSELWEGREDSLRSTLISSVIGTHVGGGAYAVAYFKK